ncbi:DUF3857 domain-containing protein [Muricauda sp. CAU 1633]|uniref:DUF3857 domain-containing protein n=1 Tax=Allomuricauda sp. CAU 1633 TaxID=2816036 RepID=UPI001A90653A|nr:DUF3857 domain-containing protein [Muricauda sp. CAU 1633]MBO0322712.1 DUF3857 domain-containing protein [Muricauda sp. CAU 1633]
MGRFILILVFFGGTWLYAQQEPEFGELTQFEKGFKSYEKDTTAHAVYLYEKGENYFEVRGNFIWLIKKYHAKKKILDRQGFDEAEISIPYYHSEKSKEQVNKIKAITHNGNTRHVVLEKNVFDVDLSERWSEKRFTFSDVQEGSILEYSYEIQSPFFYNLTGWNFQSGIPKVYTEYNALIPANYIYNRTLVGEIPLDINEADVRRSCFSVPGYPKAADCEKLKYVMRDVPAFKDDEEYMLSSSNYRSRLEFELSEHYALNGIREKYTKSWKDVDKEFRSDRDIGGQLRKKNFFERNVSLDIITGDEDQLTKAKKIYSFVKEHYTWNEKYGIFRDNRVKEAFEERIGNVAEINITLINLLNAADIKTDLMMISTRNHGLPKRNHPVMSDFNYLVAKVDIDGVTYLLDATEKELPFGMLPFRCLNYYGRVMDLDGESYWYDIKPVDRNVKSVRISMDLNLEEGKITGILDETSMGYESFFKREKINALSEEEYLDEVENGLDDFYVEAYEVDQDQSDDQKLVERFSFEIQNFEHKETIYFDPFITRFFPENPFKVEKRYYPVDFGFLRNYKYAANIKVPEGYSVKELPESISLGLPENSGILRLVCNESQGEVFVLFDLQLRSTQYTSSGYAYVKEFFEKAVLAQNQSFVVLEKN